MRVNIVRSCSRPRTQRGLSIVEFLVGVTVGLFVVAGAAKLMVDTVGNNRRLLVEARVNQDLRAAADVVARDLRRAGYWVNSTAGVWGTGAASVVPNQYANVATSGTDVTYAYARDSNDTVGINEEAGFQLVSVGGVGVLQVWAGADGWQPLTDSTAVDVTGFSVTLTPYTRELWSYCNCLKTLTCTETSIKAAGTDPRLTIRVFNIALTGRSRTFSTDGIERTVNEAVRVRNDRLTGTCPA